MNGSREALTFVSFLYAIFDNFSLMVVFCIIIDQLANKKIWGTSTFRAFVGQKFSHDIPKTFAALVLWDSILI
jgi:hypothetical protein